MQECAALEMQLKAEIQSEQQISLQLRQSLQQVQQSLAATHASLTWRMTAPLRTFAIMMSLRNPDRVDTLAKVNAVPHHMPVQENEPAPQRITEAPPIAVQPVLTSSLTDASPLAIETMMPTSTQPTDTQHPVAASSIEELLAYHDLQFVCCAYQTILGRAPDPDGQRYYLGRMRTGIAKIQLLKQLRYSPEGRAYACALPGLDVQIRRYQIGQLPLVGWIYRLVSGVEGARPGECKLRGIENQLLLLSDESSRRFNQIDSAMAGLHQCIVQLRTRLIHDPSNINHSTSFDDALKTSALNSEPDGLRQLSPRARDIYFQLKTAAAIHAGRAA
ncbi:MAG: hypothetical protein NVS3B3_15680 [Aquirhabdus sp.]